MSARDWSFPSFSKGGAVKTAVTGRLQPPLSLVGLAILAALVTAVLGVLEIRSSWLDAWLFPAVAQRATFTLEAGRSRMVEPPGRGPYDQRLGYSSTSEFVRRLESRGYYVAAQARNSRMSRTLSALGLFPIYREKDQAGLRILDRNGQPLYDGADPRQVYPTFASVPPLVVHTLLFIENRHMLDPLHPYRNPAAQWGRLSRAFWDLGIHTLDRHHSYIGGSTLATQLEKIRHSPGGRTGSIVEKARQMASASLLAYREGPRTLNAQRQIIVDYLNSIPLSATRQQGDVIGLADGLRAWYGADFKRVNELLAAPESRLNASQLSARARAYREVLSLLLALRAPSRDLVRQPAALVTQTARYLRALSAAGIISPRLREQALRTNVRARPPIPPVTPDYAAHKASNAIRVALVESLGVPSAYALDRLDLAARTTIDGGAQKSVAAFLRGLTDEDAVEDNHLDQSQLLDVGNPRSVIYSVTLYQHVPGANVLRVQTDNYNEPLDINQDTRLQLGSTAKLRTLIEYLQIVEALHHEFGKLPAGKLKGVAVAPGDRLTAWALDYLAAAPDRSLQSMLEAALQRRYSASPGEAFFTAGGLHHFGNFERSEDSQIMTVSQGFQQSVNLVFIRLMRDIERYYMFRMPGASPNLLSYPQNPARLQYLRRFADFEGRTFLQRFYEEFQGRTPGQALETLLAGVHLTTSRAAVIFRSVYPQAGFGPFTAFLGSHLHATALTQEDLPKLYAEFAPGKLDLNDRGYLAHVHPLALWLVHYLDEHPKATVDQVIAHSASQRQQVYRWLFHTRHSHAQDKRIETLLERDAFQKIHHDWQQLGYPFDSLVPSYATSIGVSGDTPQALAGLAGILVNDGMRYPAVSVEQFQFASGTPYETILAARHTSGQQVLSPLIAKLVRREMIGVVENGTGRRVSGGFTLPGGVVLPIGGKTGTGDNRFHAYGHYGQLAATRVVNRTAAFVFFIGDRFYGTVLAFVPGKAAGSYHFTSALAVQLLKDLEPRLQSLTCSRPDETRQCATLPNQVRGVVVPWYPA